jgi:cell division transport system permease protein
MKDVIKNIRRTPYQSFATFFSLFLTLFLSLAIFFTLTFLYGMLGYVESRPQVTVYFKQDVKEDAILAFKQKLVDMGKVSSIKYVSKTEALNIYKELNRDNPLLLEMVTADILPASLEIYATKPEYFDDLVNEANKTTGVDEVSFQKNIIDRLLSLTSIVRKVSLAFFGYFIVTTVIILISITHFKIALKKDEIELLQLLGASRFYIKKPFLKEALFFGLLTSSIVFSIFMIIFLILRPFLSVYLSGVTNLGIDLGFYFLTVWPITLEFAAAAFLFTAFFGIAISTVSTHLATQKYIK